MWLDMDGDGRQGASEPGLPGIRVELSGEVAVATFATRNFAAATPVSRSMETDAAGHFSFPDLPVGMFRLQAYRPTSLNVSYDSDGAPDAQASVDLPTGGLGKAVVGLVGRAHLVGTVHDAGGTPVTGSVVVRWLGPDGTAQTADDVLFVVTATDGRIDQSGLPAGEYRIEAVAGVATSVPFVLTTTGTTVVQVNPALAEQAIAAPAGSLAQTGSSPGPALAAALLLLLGGTGLVLAGRRRRPDRS